MKKHIKMIGSFVAIIPMLFACGKGTEITEEQALEKVQKMNAAKNYDEVEGLSFEYTASLTEDGVTQSGSMLYQVDRSEDSLYVYMKMEAADDNQTTEQLFYVDGNKVYAGIKADGEEVATVEITAEEISSQVGDIFDQLESSLVLTEDYFEGITVELDALGLVEYYDYNGGLALEVNASAEAGELSTSAHQRIEFNDKGLLTYGVMEETSKLGEVETSAKMEMKINYSATFSRKTAL